MASRSPTRSAASAQPACHTWKTPSTTSTIIRPRRLRRVVRGSAPAQVSRATATATASHAEAGPRTTAMRTLAAASSSSLAPAGRRCRQGRARPVQAEEEGTHAVAS
jgi:hypothetical protein